MIFESIFQTLFLLVFLVFFWSVLGIGVSQLFVRLDKDSGNDLTAPYSISTVLAMGMTAWFCAGSFLLSIGYFKFWTFALLFGLSIWVSRKQLKLYWHSYNQSLRACAKQFEQTTKWENTLIFFIILFFLLSMVAFVAPIESDGAGYYLPIAKLWAESGMIQMLRGYDDFSSIGAFAEVQIATIYLLEGEYWSTATLASAALAPCVSRSQ